MQADLRRDLVQLARGQPQCPAPPVIAVDSVRDDRVQAVVSPRSCTTTRIRSFALPPRAASAERPRNVGIVAEPIATNVLDDSDVFRKSAAAPAHGNFLSNRGGQAS